MAREVQTIINELDDAQAAQPALSSLNSPSQTAIYTLWKGITAIVINFLEQLWDLFRGELETTISKGKIGSALWLQDMVYKFQYSATVPQVVQVINFAAGYYVVDPTLRIITRCSIKTTGNKIVTIKVAKSDPPEALTLTEKNSLIGYVTNIGFTGIQYVVRSSPPDVFYLKASIYYDGQYSSVIQTTVIAAIENYFASLAFDGTLQLLTIEDYIQRVPGVTDIVIEDAAITPDGGSITYLAQNKQTIFPTYTTFSGYVVPDSTPGNTLADKLTFLAK